MSNMIPSQVAPVTRFHSGAAMSVPLAIEPSIIGCRTVGPCRCCLPFAGVHAQQMSDDDPSFNLPFAGVSAQ